MSEKIVCPECGGTAGFEETTCNVCSTVSITLDVDGDIQFGNPEITEDDESRLVYHCVECGYQLENVSNIDEFIEWLKNHVITPYYMNYKFEGEDTLPPWQECKARTLADAKVEAEDTFKGHRIILYVGSLNDFIEEVCIIAKRPALKDEWINV